MKSGEARSSSEANPRALGAGVQRTTGGEGPKRAHCTRDHRAGGDNRATFYGHFRDQDELFDWLISEAFREELQRRLPSYPGLDEKNFKALVLVTCEYLTGLNTACSWRDQQFRPLIEAPVQTELYEHLLGGIEASPEKASNQKVSRGVTASVISWAIFGAALDRSRNGTARLSEEVADQVLSVIVEGLQV